MSSLLVIGAGPGGYVAAIYAAQKGHNVTLVDKGTQPGGTCLNRGCIPSKALLNITKKYWDATHYFQDYGIQISKPIIDLNVMMSSKDKTVAHLGKGLTHLFKKNNIRFVQGAAKFLAPQEILVGEEKITADHVVLATGSVPFVPEGFPIDETHIMTSTGCLHLQEIPQHLSIIGGGVIGLELGQVWARLGAKVSVFESAPRLLPHLDEDISKEVETHLHKYGMTFHFNANVTYVGRTAGGGCTLTVNGMSVDSSHILIATGRQPKIETLNLEGVALDARGRVKVNQYYETTCKNIYAIGDLIPGPMLAHKASEEALAVVEHLSGESCYVDYNLIPSVMYTAPEVASVGLAEKDAKNARVGKFSFSGNSRAKAEHAGQGFIKMISDARTDKILGVHIVGPHAGELIAEAVAVMSFGGSSEDIARICHAHPTYMEGLKEAAFATFSKGIHQ